jgi:hypothetical protein
MERGERREGEAPRKGADVRVGSNASVLAGPGDVCSTPNSDPKAHWSLGADCVAKLVLHWCPKILRAAGAAFV